MLAKKILKAIIKLTVEAIPGNLNKSLSGEIIIIMGLSEEKLRGNRLHRRIYGTPVGRVLENF